MANYFNLTLDTTAPASPAVIVNNYDAYTSSQLVTLIISTADTITTGYQMKIWGTVDTANDANVQATETASTWITYATSKAVKLATADGIKTVYLKIRDDVFNESAQTSDSITLDTTLPAVTISVAPDVTKVSKVSGKDACSFSFQVDTSFILYKVKVVSSTNATQDVGTQIPITAGSTNMSGTGSFPAVTNINCTIKGADLETASIGDTTKIVKVFTKDSAGNWST